MNFKNRSLSAYEKIFWITDQTIPAHFVIAAEITGTSTEEEWRRALDAVQQRHALFSACIESNDGINPYFKYDSFASIPLKVVEGLSTSEWENEIRKEMSSSFDFTQAPLLRTVLVQENNKSILIMTVHHAISDGLSMSLVIRDILDALSGKSLERLPMPSSTDDLLGFTRPINDIQRQSGTLKSNCALQKRTEPAPGFHLLKLSEELTSRLIKRCQKERTTVHGALCAAFVRAYNHLIDGQQPEKINIATPFSIRDVLGAGESSSLSIGTKYTAISQESKTYFWDIARYVKDDLKDILSLKKITESLKAVNLRAFNDMTTEELSEALYNNSITRHLIISNLGRIGYDTTFGSLKLEALWLLTSTGNKVERFVGISTVNGQMCVSLAGRELSDNLLIAAEIELTSACS